MINKSTNETKTILRMVETYIISHPSPTKPNYTWSFGSLVGKFKYYFGTIIFKKAKARLKLTLKITADFLYKDKQFCYFIFFLATISLIIPAILLWSIIDWESINVETQFPLEVIQDNYLMWNNVSIYFDFFLILIFTISATLYWFMTNYSTLQIFYVFLPSFYICLFFISAYLIIKDYNILTLENIVFDSDVPSQYGVFVNALAFTFTKISLKRIKLKKYNLELSEFLIVWSHIFEIKFMFVANLFNMFYLYLIKKKLCNKSDFILSVFAIIPTFSFDKHVINSALVCILMVVFLISFFSHMLDINNFRYNKTPYKEAPNPDLHGTFIMLGAVTSLMNGEMHRLVFYFYILNFFFFVFYVRQMDHLFRAVNKKAWSEIIINLKQWKKQGIFVNFFSNIWKFAIAFSGIVFSLYSSSVVLSYIPFFLIYMYVCIAVGHNEFTEQIIYSWDFLIFAAFFIILFIGPLLVLLTFYLSTKNFSLKQYKETPFFRDFTYSVWIQIFGDSFENVRSCTKAFCNLVFFGLITIAIAYKIISILKKW